MINWGILGYGRMGLSFSKVIKETSNSKLIYIGSKTANNKSENILKGYDDVIKDKNIDAIDNDGYTALHKAAYYGYVDICKILIENDCDLNIQNKSGNKEKDIIRVKFHI